MTPNLLFRTPNPRKAPVPLRRLWKSPKALLCQDASSRLPLSTVVERGSGGEVSCGRNVRARTRQAFLFARRHPQNMKIQKQFNSQIQNKQTKGELIPSKPDLCTAALPFSPLGGRPKVWRLPRDSPRRRPDGCHGSGQAEGLAPATIEDLATATSGVPRRGKPRRRPGDSHARAEHTKKQKQFSYESPLYCRRPKAVTLNTTTPPPRANP
jgi:hypothetical protein